MADPKTIRVEIEYEDGNMRRLTGEAAQKWADAVQGEALFAFAHGQRFPEFPWEILPPKT